MKEEALKLADQLDGLNSCEPVIIKACETMIRRLVEELDKQGEPVAWWNGKSKFCSPRDKSWDAKTGGILSFGCNIPLYTTPQTKPLSDEEIVEKLADLEHQQWMSWADSIMKSEKISDNRFARWASLMIPYSELSEEMKEHDRVWARKVLTTIEERHGLNEK